MEYQKHKSNVNNCYCLICNADICVKNVTIKFDESRKLSVIDLKKAKMARINRSCPASHHRRKVMVEGYNQRQAPPPKRNTVRIFQAINNEHRDSKWRLKIPVFLGVRGVNNAPPSARKRNYVHELIQRENQTESFAV